MLSSYINVWKIFLASWFQKWDLQKKEIEKFRQQFKKVPVTANLFFNVVYMNVFIIVLLSNGGFSESFQQFALWWVVLPSLTTSLSFYRYHYGPSFMNEISWKTNSNWLQNWILLQAMSLVNMTQTAIIYVFGLVIEKMLPESLQWSYRFPLGMIEEGVQNSLRCFYGLAIILALSTPLWTKGYNISMEVLERKERITNLETLIDLVYQTGLTPMFIFSTIPLFAVAESAGFRVHLIHVVFAAIEILLVNWTVQFKFCINHQLFHEIQPLYAMAHIEHHISKGVHSTTLGSGIWESWSAGHNIFITPTFLSTFPYLLFQSLYCGINMLTHTMWPSKYWIQYHTLHHIILADIYNANIPSSYDYKNSKTVKQFDEKLKSISPFVKYPALSDCVGLALMIICGTIMHQGFGIGVARIDWDEVIWHSHHVSASS